MPNPGEQLWLYSLNEGERGADAPRQLSGRGLAHWTDGDEERILYVSPGYRLIALNARTGRPIPSFAEDGILDLRETLDQDVDFETDRIGLHSPPTVANDVVIVGAAHSPFVPPELKTNVTGYIRGFDVVTGRLLWTFHTIPRRGEAGYETWLDGSAEEAGGNAGVWAAISADEELELVYLPVESPYSDMYGGLRQGDNLFGESIVAIDLNTGERRWHYQLVHHPLWDHDIPTAPVLVNAVKDGQTIKALAQPTKQGLLFVVNRETGEPIWPIEEVPVPNGNVPGERYSPTQPMPTVRYGHQGIGIDDLIDFTPRLRAEAERLVARHRIGPLYTPAVLNDPEGPISTLMVMGGSNWPGGTYDPETNIVYVTASVRVNSMTICEYPEGSAVPFGICLGPERGIFGGLPEIDVQGLPLLKPPTARSPRSTLAEARCSGKFRTGTRPTRFATIPRFEAWSSAGRAAQASRRGRSQRRRC